MKNFTCHSGGAIGSDTFWENIGILYNVKTIAYSFDGHNTKSKNAKILTFNELLKADDTLKSTAKKRNINLNYFNNYVYNLLRRNYYQVINSESIFAISTLTPNNSSVNGGTGWAVEMAKIFKKPIYVFDISKSIWLSFSYIKNIFTKTDEPILTKNFAGIGTRNINSAGINAIQNIYNNTLKSLK